MIEGILTKFEPTDKGVTVTIKCDDDQMPQIVRKWKQKVRIDGEQATVFPAAQDALNEILNAQEDVYIMARKLVAECMGETVTLSEEATEKLIELVEKLPGKEEEKKEEVKIGTE